jgi:hypothetical protein
MYIFVKRSVPDNLVPVVTAHSSLACYKKFETDPEMQEWITRIFRKVVCVVNDLEFESLKLVERNIVLTESGLENEEVTIAFCPRANFPESFKKFPLWSAIGF